MAAGYDIGASLATSSGAQGGTAGTGEFILGGSGGANKLTLPWFIWAGLAVVGAIFLFKALFPARRK
jgi:hypothetical protein